MTRAAIYEKYLHQQTGLNFKTKLVRFYILSLWSILLYGVETMTLQQGHKYLKSFDTCCWIRIEKISLHESVYNEDVLCTVKEEKKYPTSGVQYNAKKASWMGHAFCQNYFLKHVVEGKTERKGRRLRRREQLLYNFNPWATNVIYIYIYMEHPFLMFLDHTQRRSTVGRTPLDE